MAVGSADSSPAGSPCVQHICLSCASGRDHGPGLCREGLLVATCPWTRDRKAGPGVWTQGLELHLLRAVQSWQPR